MLAAIVNLLAAVAQFLQNRQLIKAGEAQEKARAYAEAMDDIRKAKEAANEVSSNPDGDYARSLRNKYSRD